MSEITEQDILKLNKEILEENRQTIANNNIMAKAEHEAKMRLFELQQIKVQGELSEQFEAPMLAATYQFHQVFGHPIEEDPIIPEESVWRLRIKLLREEVKELEDAFIAGDLVEVADAEGDIAYILGGTIACTGTAHQFQRIFNDIHSSNMSKACLSETEARATIAHYENKGVECSYILRDNLYIITRDEDCKVLKSINYQPVDLTYIK